MQRTAAGGQSVGAGVLITRTLTYATSNEMSKKQVIHSSSNEIEIKIMQFSHRFVLQQHHFHDRLASAKHYAYDVIEIRVPNSDGQISNQISIPKQQKGFSKYISILLVISLILT